MTEETRQGNNAVEARVHHLNNGLGWVGVVEWGVGVLSVSNGVEWGSNGVGESCLWLSVVELLGRWHVVPKWKGLDILVVGVVVEVGRDLNVVGITANTSWDEGFHLVLEKEEFLRRHFFGVEVHFVHHLFQVEFLQKCILEEVFLDNCVFNKGILDEGILDEGLFHQNLHWALFNHLLTPGHLVHLVSDCWDWDLNFGLDLSDIFWLVNVQKNVLHDLVPVQSLDVHVLLDRVNSQNFLYQFVIVGWHDRGVWDHFVDP